MANSRSETRSKPKKLKDGTVSPWPGASAVLLHLLERGAEVKLLARYVLYIEGAHLRTGKVRSFWEIPQPLADFSIDLKGLKAAIARLHEEYERDVREIKAHRP